ncbi:universal stress protein [Phytomonospora sp. NPDC050363]|uniref:universal stress protein n=1 Tax=Phytomonospora sp. NPDC050363 TaxID=3155642 RepID=UPI0033CE9F08
MRIIVGADGSPSALNAVRTATVEAARRGGHLRIVHAFLWPLMHVPLGPSPSGPPTGGLRHEAERILAEAAETAAATDPAVKVETELVTGFPAQVLLAEAATAELVVIGDRGLGAVAEMVIGSVALQVAERSPVPVLVVKGRTRGSGPVLIGLDGSPASSRALRVAFDAAALRGVDLVAAHVRAEAVVFDATPASLYERDATWTQREWPFTAALDRERRRKPTVVATDEVMVGDAGEAIVARARHAQLIVVGAHGRTGFFGRVLGSVSRHVLRHAPCPVLIVPPPLTDEKGTAR